MVLSLAEPSKLSGYGSLQTRKVSDLCTAGHLNFDLCQFAKVQEVRVRWGTYLAAAMLGLNLSGKLVEVK